MSGAADEEQEKKMMAALQNKRNMLAGYCKLVIYGVLELSAATDVFKNYFKVMAGRCCGGMGYGISCRIFELGLSSD